ncbi:hypothetical protein GGX14DRAFT_436845 [Mycena pura]|uniref:Uncharacterized protein n=1 Tax=Mycena pura TaxID=153505 RepID=A0AAD6VQ98_9AGAR|nr:hypothetical protein GGX14DRAFT_436845 [Mycena pura]
MRLPHSFILLVFALLVNSTVTNTTIDDSSSNFTFTGSWNTITPDEPCPGCSSQPDPSQVYGGTWHDGNIFSPTSGSFTFKGSAVYMFGIDQVTTQPDIAFTLGTIQSVHHYEGTEQFVYNALFFSATGLASDDTHTLDWVFNIADTGVEVQAALFDYAIVTSGDIDAPIVKAVRLILSFNMQHNVDAAPGPVISAIFTVSHHPLIVHCCTVDVEQDTNVVGGITTVTAQSPASSHSKSKSKSNLGAIIGGAVGALVVATLAILALYIRSRQRRRMRSEREKTAARSQFLRIEDYPLHRLQSAETHQARNSLPNTLLIPSRRNVDTIAGTSTASLLDGYPLTDPTWKDMFESPGIIGILSAQPAENASNGNLRHLEERLATLEAQVAGQQLQQPPPYIHDDDS